MFAAFYGLVIGLYVMPGDFTHYVDLIKGLELPKWFLFPAKMVVAFPLMYHYINGIRHLVGPRSLYAHLKYIVPGSENNK